MSAVSLTFSPAASLDVVFKVHELCNINCSYCYMYSQGNSAFQLVPQKQASDEVWLGVAAFIVRETLERDPSKIRLVMHGGEPMLIKAATFDRKMTLLWDELTTHLTPERLGRVELVMQTNGILVNNAWIEVLKRWNISTGVSIDGPEAVHDRQRVDKKGRGTYAQVVDGIRMLAADDEIQKRGLGALCVVDPLASGAVVYRHLVDDLGFNGFNFLFPFMNWDNYDQAAVSGVSRFLVDAFREWCDDASQGRIRNVRVFLEVLESLRSLGQPWALRDTVTICHDIVVVEADGTVMIEESLRPTFEGYFSDQKLNDISVASLRTVPEDAQVYHDTYSIADECRDCALVSACRSGAAIGRVGFRYATVGNQVRKSVYCSTYIELYVAAVAFVKGNPESVPRFGEGLAEFAA